MSDGTHIKPNRWWFVYETRGYFRINIIMSVVVIVTVFLFCFVVFAQSKKVFEQNGRKNKKVRKMTSTKRD